MKIIMTKGIALPMEAIIIVALCLIVLTTISFIFLKFSGEQQTMISDSAAFAKGCISWMYDECTKLMKEIQIEGYVRTSNIAEPNTLETACEFAHPECVKTTTTPKVVKTLDPDCCKKACCG